MPTSQQNKGVPSLVHLARLKCIENAFLITDIGCTPYHLVEPILKKKTARSLRMIERNSPQVVQYSEPLWRSLIARDFSSRPLDQVQVRGGKRVQVPSRVLYERYTKEKEEQRRQATETFKHLTTALRREKNKHKVKTLDHVIIPPRGSRRLIEPMAGSSPFKSSLLERARHQNKMRCHFLSGGRRNNVTSKQSGIPFPGRKISTPSYTDRIVRSMAPYPEMIPKKRSLHTTDLSATKRKRQRRGNGRKKSNVYIYDGK